MKDFSWSYSAYSSALNCLYCFHQQYILEKKQEGLESADLVFGTSIHSAVNSIWSGENGLDVFNLFWGTQNPAQLEYTRFQYDELATMGAKFCNRFQNKYADRFKMQRGELRLHGAYNRVKLNGQFDFYGTLDDKLSLLDLKTSAYNYPLDKRLTALQLNLYAYLLMQNGFKAPEQLGYVVLVKGSTTIQAPLVWDFDEAACTKFVDEMTQYCKMFSGIKTFPSNPNCQRHNFGCYKEMEKRDDRSDSLTKAS